MTVRFSSPESVPEDLGPAGEIIGRNFDRSFQRLRQLGATGLVVAAGQWTTVAASDTMQTGLKTVVAAFAQLESTPGDNPEFVTAQIGDQGSAPPAGSILIKSWQNTTGTDPTPIAATAFSKVVNWIAVGTA